MYINVVLTFSLYFNSVVSKFGWSLCPGLTLGFGIQAILHSKIRMVKYFCNNTDIRSTWDHVFSAFWQRYPNPYRYCDVFIVSRTLT